MGMREVVIKALLVDPSNNSPVVLLKDRKSQKALPIWIGDAEAISIAFGLQNEDFPRPLTHALMKEMLEDLRASVERVVIKEVKDGTYFASIFVKDSEGGLLEFDARPSDSLALSLRAGCPIFIADAVFDAAAIESPFAEEDEFQEFVEEDLDLREFRRRRGEDAAKNQTN
ncbi:MAG: bifunctional nuclease family protein [Candidatus Bipolaricaulis sp.]|nr:bifunctional nuclease family protein [Candidatus Bipolaricaulis sp.]MDD5220324.1 bifunctional nuclease family protein [Candidatus Bipolaricaulis sp.]